MKKAVVILLILVALGATAFGFGYVPLRLEPGTRAVLFSKTSGWSHRVFEAGQFAWAWELLIPTNATLYVFSDEPRQVRVESRSVLPSADVYAQYIDGQPDFTQRVTLRVRYRLAAEGLRELVPSGLRPDGVDDWYQDTDAAIQTRVLQIVGQEVSNSADSDTPLTSAALTSVVQERLVDRMPEITVIALSVDAFELPDVELYRQARDTFRAVQTARREALASAARELATAQASNDARIGNLERYGQVLTDYPVLLDYLEIAAQNNSDPLDLTQLQALGAAGQP